MEIKTNSKKRILKCLMSLLIVLVLLFGLTGCGSGDIGINKFDVTDTNMSVEYNSYFDEYYVTITGKAKNKTRVKFSYVDIEFSLYDADGNSIGVCDDFISVLGGGETWYFEATSLGVSKKPVSFKLSAITCW